MPRQSRCALLGERADALGEVLGAERGVAQRVQLGDERVVERRVERAQHALVAAHATAGESEAISAASATRVIGDVVDDLVHEAPGQRRRPP